MLEYAIVTAILIAVFVVVADKLFTTVSYRGNESANTVRQAVPCSEALQSSAGPNDPNPCL